MVPRSAPRLATSSVDGRLTPPLVWHPDFRWLRVADLLAPTSGRMRRRPRYVRRGVAALKLRIFELTSFGWSNMALWPQSGNTSIVASGSASA